MKSLQSKSIANVNNICTGNITLGRGIELSSLTRLVLTPRAIISSPDSRNRNVLLQNILTIRESIVE